MSQVTLALFRRLKTMFGADADVGFPRAGLPDHGDAGGRGRCWPRTSPCSSRMGADIALLERGRAGAAFPWLATGWRRGRRLRPIRRGLVRSAEPRRAVPQGRQRPTASTIAATTASPASRRGERVESRRAGERQPHRLRQPRQRGRPLGRRAGGAGRHAAAGRAAQALRLRHRLPRGVRGAAPGAADRRSVRRVVPPRGPLFLCGKSPEESEEPPAGDLDAIDHAFFEQRGLAAARRARAGVRERQGGERLGRLLRLQHARPERGDRPASRARQLLLRQRLLRARRAAGRRRRAAPSPS